MLQLRILITVMFTITPYMVFAQTGRTDSDEFAKCSQQTNQLYHLNLDLDRHHDKVDAYNRRHDFLRVLLDRREKFVQRVDQQMQDDPANRKLWKNYDDAFGAYQRAIERVKGWNVYGDQLGTDYQSAIDQVVGLQETISQDCGGTWELAIIHKFCDDLSGRHSEFCKAFDG
jgi:hypothetical protein